MHTDGGVWGIKEACPYQSKRNISPKWIISVKYKQKIYGTCIFEVRNEAFQIRRYENEMIALTWVWLVNSYRWHKKS